MTENSELQNTAASVTLVGAGGCGINIVRGVLLSEVLDPSMYGTKAFDTSLANQTKELPVTVIANGHGSGGVRKENAEDAQDEISNLTDDQLGKPDIAIVCFSLSGGSGSVTGPLLLREYARRGCRVIGCVIADTSSVVYSKNTLSTLRTLKNISSNNNLYLPMLYFSNQDASKSEVNNAILNQLTNSICLFTKDVKEIDRSDRINFLNGIKTFGGEPGLKLLSLFNQNFEERELPLFYFKKSELYDAILALGVTSQDNVTYTQNLPVNAQHRKDGTLKGQGNVVSGVITSNIEGINKTISQINDYLTKVKQHKTKQVEALETDVDDDLVF